MHARISRSDLSIAALKGAIGALPVVGPVVAELVGTVLPNRRLERVEALLAALEAKVAPLGAETVRAALESEEMSALLEDGLYLAARSVGSARKTQIAAVIGNAIGKEEVAVLEQRRLLAILGELNEVELKVLYFYSLNGHAEQKAYASANPEVRHSLQFGDFAHLDESDAIMQSYLAHLEQLRLLRPTFREPRKSEFNFSLNRGIPPQQVLYYSIASLGRLLLKAADVGAPAV